VASRAGWALVPMDVAWRDARWWDADAAAGIPPRAPRENQWEGLRPRGPGWLVVDVDVGCWVSGVAARIPGRKTVRLSVSRLC